MSMDFSNLDLLQLIPEQFRSDPATIALCNAFQPVFDLLDQQMQLVLIYTNIDNLSGAVLDELAWGWDVLWYDPTDTILARRQTIKDALKVFSTMGTAGAIKRAVSAAFGDASVEEWWEYNADPGYFRILVEDPEATAARATAFLKIVNAVKNARSHLDQIILMKISQAPMYWGAASSITKKTRSEQVNG